MTSRACFDVTDRASCPFLCASCPFRCASPAPPGIISQNLVNTPDGMGVNEPGIDVILHLLDQLHGVRQALEGVNASLRDPRA